MVELCFTADDLGMNRRVNEAILKAHRSGALTAASLMMGQPGTEHAIELARATPTLKVGWHLHLCDSRPLTAADWPWGRSARTAGWRLTAGSSWDLVSREIDRQWEAYQATGLRCDFVNTHHHLHFHPRVYGKLLRALEGRFSGWLRMGRACFFLENSRSKRAGAASGWVRAWRARSSPYRLSDTLWGLDRLFAMRTSEIRRVVAQLPAGLHEFMFHPRGADTDRDLETLLELRQFGFENGT
ncbi:MAG: ChbG/HpnK family deacetylase [Verrucomicrobiae bacterium]|nr:ChbG/HpnK family deacetylase [Verrucomicrobiae bacterium]